MLAVDVLVQAIVVARPISQQERRRFCLSRCMASRAERFVVGGVADRDAHRLIPAVGDRRKPRIEAAAKRADELGQRVGEIFVLAAAEAVLRHHDAGAEAGVVLVEGRNRAAGLRREQPRRDRRAERVEVGFERRPVQRVDCCSGARSLIRPAVAGLLLPQAGGGRAPLSRLRERGWGEGIRRHHAASRSRSLRLRSTPQR